MSNSLSARRIAIVGNGGGGKSTLARRLSEEFDIPLFAVDQVQFLPGWQSADPGTVAAWHREILTRNAWIIDGWGGWDLIDARLATAELVVLVDYPREVHLELARRRSELSRRGNAPDAPPGCLYHEIDDRMDETLRRVDRDFMPVLRDKVSALDSAKVATFRTLAELDAWSAITFRR